MSKDSYKFSGAGLTSSELGWAKKRFKTYQNHYHIENFSDLSLLEELVVREAQQERYKEETVRISESEKVKESGLLIPAKYRKALDENLEQILILKEKLGLFEDKEKETLYNYIQTIEKKAKKYREEHPEEYSFPCPHCSKMIHSKVRMNEKNFIITEHPFFDGKFLSNKYLLKLYKEKKLTKDDIAQLIKIPVDYVNKLLKKYQNKL